MFGGYLNVFLPPLPEVANNFEIQNPWGKVVSDLKILLIKGVKLPHKKNVFWANFALMSRIFLVSLFLTPFKGLFFPLPEVQCQNFLDFQNPWGKVMERRGLRFENFCS